MRRKFYRFFEIFVLKIIRNFTAEKRRITFVSFFTIKINYFIFCLQASIIGFVRLWIKSQYFVKIRNGLLKFKIANFLVCLDNQYFFFFVGVFVDIDSSTEQAFYHVLSDLFIFFASAVITNSLSHLFLLSFIFYQTVDVVVIFLKFFKFTFCHTRWKDFQNIIKVLVCDFHNTVGFYRL